MKKIMILLLIVSVAFVGCVHLQKASLNKSAAKGDMEEVKEYLKSGSNINEPDKSGRTPLMNAINYKKIEIAKYLIEKGANVNIKDAYGYVALIIAVDLGYAGYDIIEPLLDHGANIESRDSSGWTPLMHTVSSYGGLNTVRLLIKRGANLDAKEPNENKTAYQLALDYRNTEIATELKRAALKEFKDTLSSKLVFIRESNMAFGGKWASIAVGGNTVNLHNGSTEFIEVKPGKCEIGIQGSFGEGNYVFPFDVETGKTYYFEISPRTASVVSGIAAGMIGTLIESSMSGNKAGPFEINILDESSAKEKIKALKQ